MSYWKPGQKIQHGKYVIDKILGGGGSGITYRAKDLSLGRLIAIKTLNAMIQSQSDFAKHQERFVQEAFRLAKCTHHNIIRVDDVCKEGELWCMVMEYIDGGTLEQYIKEMDLLSETEALRYIHQTGQALSYVHHQGFLHRDVKPGNIMLRSRSQEAVLIDFGLARDFLEDRIQVHTNSRTEGFAPIEQYERKAKRGAYTDVYALAATMYYLLTKQVPFPAPFCNQGISLIPPQQLNPQISDMVNNAILQGMELHPEKRPQSIIEWLDLLPASNQPLSEPIKETPTVFAAGGATYLPPPPPPRMVVSPPPSPPSSTLERKQPGTVNSAAESPPSGKAKIRAARKFSAVGINYTPLRDLLTAGKWDDADRETAKLMLKVVQREKDGWLDEKSIIDFPPEDLWTIDQLWVKFSKGHFGFSVQKVLYQCLGGGREYNWQVWDNLCEQLGWRAQGNLLSRRALTFNPNAPQGHLPWWAGWSGGDARAGTTLLCRKDLV